MKELLCVVVREIKAKHNENYVLVTARIFIDNSTFVNFEITKRNNELEVSLQDIPIYSQKLLDVVANFLSKVKLVDITDLVKDFFEGEISLANGWVRETKYLEVKE